MILTRAMNFQDLIPILQLSISPVILISGVGLVLLSMTNRYGRVIDRARILSDVLRRSPGEESIRFASQLAILSRRARLLRLSILLASASVLFAAFLIIVIFLLRITRLEWSYVVVGLFFFCMASLIGSLIVFILDINASLGALELETVIDGKNKS
jgi:hypothetical protein